MIIVTINLKPDDEIRDRIANADLSGLQPDIVELIRHHTAMSSGNMERITMSIHKPNTWDTTKFDSVLALLFDELKPHIHDKSTDMLGAYVQIDPDAKMQVSQLSYTQNQHTSVMGTLGENADNSMRQVEADRVLTTLMLEWDKAYIKTGNDRKRKRE